VGPVWHGGGDGEAELLARCHRNALRLLREWGLRTIAFPAISCGVYGYPGAQAAKVSMAALRNALATADDIDVTLCCFSDAMRAVFQQALDQPGG
jgi:O-acetyl-ADP-ribose deacetylase (regulator of RNase III)